VKKRTRCSIKSEDEDGVRLLSCLEKRYSIKWPPKMASQVVFLVKW
jgi:hypothetical protein